MDLWTTAALVHILRWTMSTVAWEVCVQSPLTMPMEVLHTSTVTINGVLQGDLLSCPSTGAWTNWEDSNLIQVPCTPGPTNTIRLTAGPNTAGPNVNSITVSSPILISQATSRLYKSTSYLYVCTV